MSAAAFGAFLLCLCSCQLAVQPSPPPDAAPSIPVPALGGGASYYLAASGDDANDGSELSPWRSLDRVNAAALKPGDSVFFRRGDSFRGQLKPKDGAASAWIAYRAYGLGEKPLLLGSVDLDAPAAWVSHGPSLWRSAETSEYDIGALFMNGTGLKGQKQWELASLAAPGDFYYDRTGDKRLYLYAAGNPADLYEGIEASLTRHVVDHSGLSYAYFENLHMSMGAAHGFGGAHTRYLTIKSCDFSWIGGGYLHTDGDGLNVRYGNAVEFWGNASYNTVDSCSAWEIYDTAFTNQNHGQTVKQEYLFYLNNLARNCGLASFEFWSRPSASTLGHIYLLHNTSVDPGQGWGVTAGRPDKNAFHIASFASSAKSRDIVVSNNVFYTSATNPLLDNQVFALYENSADDFDAIDFSHNLWHAPVALWALGPGGTESQYHSLAELQGAHNNFSLNVDEEPLFMDAAYGDYRLAEASPGVDAGESSLRAYDALGFAVSGVPDMGAFEYH
jgi:hypothetical protein